MRKIFIAMMVLAVVGLFAGCEKIEEALSAKEIKAEQDEKYNEAETPEKEEIVVINEEDVQTKVNVEIPDADDMQAVIKAAYELFVLANQNDQKCLRRLAYTRNLVSTMGIEARNLIIEVKNNEEYLKYDFQPDVKKLGITVEGHAKATYAKVGLEKAYYVEAKDCVIDDDWQGYGVFDDAEGTLAIDTDRLYFHASHKPLYCVTEAVVSPDTIESATLTHDDAGGYYTIVFHLNAKKASKYLLHNLRDGSDMNDAKYESITETIEIWDNGFFKSFLSVDKWSGTKVIKINSTIHYETTYSYSADDCDLAQYSNGYYADIKAAAEKANADALAQKDEEQQDAA